MTDQQRTDVHHLASAPVVVGIDGSEAADAAVDWAADLAVRRRRELRIVHGSDLGGFREVFGRNGISMHPALDELHARAGVLVMRAAQRACRDLPAIRLSTEVSDAAATRLLLEWSGRAYVVVLGSSGLNDDGAHVGSVLLSVCARARGAVIVVRTDDNRRVAVEGSVAVGVDGSDVSEPAIGRAFEEASERGADLVAVHSWSDLRSKRYAGLGDFITPIGDVQGAEQALLAERLAGWQEKYPDVTVLQQVHLADPARNLLECSKTAQLLVVGSRGHAGLTGALLGSTSNSLVQHAHCPVMVVHTGE